MKRIDALLVLLTVAAAAAPAVQKHTRGVGVYPGNPAEDHPPVLVPDSSSYRNLALRRPAYQSSSYDYNLTAQLATDGVTQSTLPRWLVTTLSTTGVAEKHQREFLLDHSATSTVNLGGPSGWMQFELAGGDAPLEIDRIELDARFRQPQAPRSPGAPNPAQPAGPPAAPPAGPAEWISIVTGSDDGQIWHEIGRSTGVTAPTPASGAAGSGGVAVNPSVSLAQPSRYRIHRVAVQAAGDGSWLVSEVRFFHGSRPVEAGGPYRFDSAWMADGQGEEWISVDLGARCSFDRVALHWIRRASEGVLQASDDGVAWRDVVPLSPAVGPSDDLKLDRPAQGRYVRVLMTRAQAPEGYILSELEVYGRGGPVPRRAARPALSPRSDGGLDLATLDWRLQRASLVTADGSALSRPGFADSEWVAATVPATVLSSYWNAGAVPDPNYGSNHLAISDSFFYADFWYRSEFTAPRTLANRRTWLNFDGINWKAEVYLNGEKIGRIEGAFMRGRLDVTGLLRPGGSNALAIRVEKNATPGSAKQKTLETAGLNGGALGADNPTYHASIGWDWIPTVRGRNIGIWNDVYLTASGPVTIDHPFVQTTLPLPDTSRADVRIEVPLRNHESTPVAGTLRGRFGDTTFEQPVTLDASSARTVVLDPSTHPVLRLMNPRLWWPVGYGAPDLYDVELTFDVGRRSSDAKSFRAGVRQFTYSEDGGALRIWINGRRFIGRGGNWGFPEANLRYRGREYDIAVRYHRDMNFTMIRNWVGQTGDEEFYDACDRHGIVVWQDFWLANPVDGPDPADNELFLRNAEDYVLRIRNHPSVGLYCGRNEGDPPKPIDDGIRTILRGSHPGLHYISDSAAGVVSGHGPYAAQTARFYFKSRATPRLHSEMGMPNIVTLDSLRQMMPEAALWPQGLEWGLHDFNLSSAQRLSGFRAIIDAGYGGADNAADWVRLAQFVNYDGYRAMFEAQSRHRMGLLLWMSHPCWPSFVWQTYDYYFDPTAGYFGSKKGSEPLHIQWNAATDAIEVVNYSAGRAAGLTARAELLNLDGSLRWEKSAPVDSDEDSVVTPFAMEYPDGLSPVHFIRLRLLRGAAALSENFYWRGVEEGNYRALRALPLVSVNAETRVARKGGSWVLQTDLHNASAQPALMVRLKAVRARSGDRILPALYSDNYVSLMPGDRRTILTRIEDADTRGEPPAIAVEGFNIRSAR